MKRSWAAGFVLVAIALLGLAYTGRLDGDYVWDDVFLVAGNPTLTEPGGLHRILTLDLWSSVGEPRSQLYHPLPMLTLWMQAHAGMLSVISGRVVNLALHLACVLGLCLLLRRLEVRPLPSMLLSLVLLAHPSTVEPVMWLTGRHDLLGVVFALAALLSWPRPTGVALCCAAALLCKEPYVVVPALVFGLAWVERDRRWLRIVPSVIAVLGVIALRRALGISSASDQLSVGVQQHLVSYASIVWHYTAQLLSLSVSPTIESYAQLGWGAWLVWLGIVAVCVGAYALRERKRLVAFGVGWFFVSLTPHVLSLPMIGLFANRYAYLPLIGLLLVAGGVTQLVEEVRIARLATGAACLLLILAVIRTRVEAATWHDNGTLYTASVEARPDDGRALYHLGHEVQVERGCEAALPLFDEATRKAPTYVRAWRNLAGCLIDVHRPADAIAPARRAVELAPFEASQHYNLGAALALSGQRDEGSIELRKALQLDPHHAQARALLDHLPR